MVHSALDKQFHYKTARAFFRLMCPLNSWSHNCCLLGMYTFGTQIQDHFWHSHIIDLFGKVASLSFMRTECCRMFIEIYKTRYTHIHNGTYK